MSVEMQTNKEVVMIIDDTPENLALLSDTLSEAAYRVLVATDGQSALEQIRYMVPDIILLDVIMPGLNGYETCQRLKANIATAHIPVLFMTALGELDDLLKGFGEGAVDYIVKPIRPPEVLARVEAQLYLARQVKRAEEALNHGSFAAMTINPDGLITWLPEAALRWLGEAIDATEVFDPIIVGNKIPEPLLEWVLTQAAQASQNEAAPFEVLRGGDHYVAKRVPCGNGSECLLLLEKHGGEWNLDSLKNSLGLTAREAEILMWISRGKTNKEVGLIIGSSPRTINKHLEHVFEKLGVVTRAAAVSVALQRTAKLTSAAED
jgi:DNA-binding response OmpR family regulator/DNA-binding CsgD family transcriptional regulator